MNLDDFSTVVDDRRYINPQVALDESNAFIQKLRDTQSSRNEQIQRDTYNLGTAVPSNLGGLGGSQSYFNARYQTPQTNSIVSNLKATAQAQALSDAMNNEIAQAKQRYSNAYKAYAKRHGNSPTTTPDNSKKSNLNINTPGSQEKINVNNENKNPLGGLGHDDSGTFWTDKDGTKTYLENVSPGASITAPFMSGLTTPPAEGGVVGYQGKKYLYAGGKWYVMK